MISFRKRIIPVLLLHKGQLYKTVRFQKPVYVGDPINAVKIFNDKEVDELILLDIDASKKNQEPDFGLITDIVSEAFMPIAYGGGVTQLRHAEKLFYNGVEKVVLNTVLLKGFGLVEEISAKYGAQSVVASIDVKKSLLGKKKVFSHASVSHKMESITEFARLCESKGAGEIMLNSVDRDGTYSGYDLELIQAVSAAVSVPLIACGGASSKADFSSAEKSGSSAMAAGSMFVFQRPHNAVLISYDV
ncbi:MAG: imidazole glycerol phosphate synthase subunit HisF [Flavobacteriales bacterium]|nr:imidazole glycerol phosphate synthase subunit HisF [Flavobacteriales bacterium]